MSMEMKQSGSFWSRLGPGIILAMMGIGTSHLVMVPLAGAQFGYSLLWVIIIAYISKYYVFSLSQFYTATTGETLMEAYPRLPGPKNWAVWMIFLFSVLLILLLAGIFGVVGTILYAAFPVLSAQIWSIISIILAVVILYSKSFNILENLNKVMALLFTLMAIIAFIASPPSARFFSGFIPNIPKGSTYLLASLVGLLPTGGLISLSYSEWVRLKFKDIHLSEQDPTEDIIKRRKIMVHDFWIGHWGSMVLAIIFLSLGATVLYGAKELPAGVNLALGMSKIFTQSLGTWVFPLFIAGMFSAIFSTGTNGLDGMSRLIYRSLSTVSNPKSILQNEKWVYRGSVIIMGLVALIINLGIFNPVTFVMIGSIIELIDVPILLAINLYIVRKNIKKPELQLKPYATYLSIASIVVLIVITILTLIVRY